MVRNVPIYHFASILHGISFSGRAPLLRGSWLTSFLCQVYIEDVNIYGKLFLLNQQDDLAYDPHLFVRACFVSEFVISY